METELHRVKYTRREYREEYLRSDEWREKRRLFIEKHPVCEKCGNRPTGDVHHLEYRNIVDVTDECMMGTCRECHEFIHDCIDVGLIPKDADLLIKRALTMSVTTDNLKARRSYLRKKVDFPKDLLGRVAVSGGHVKLKVYGVLRWTPNFLKELGSIKITGAKIEKIEDLLLKEFYRRNRRREERNPIRKNVEDGEWVQLK